MLQAPISELKISDGTVLQVPRNGTVVFVGPNNAGKSQALRDLHALLSSKQPDTELVVTSIDVNKESNEEEVQTWLDEKCDYQFSGGSVRYFRFGQGGEPANQNVQRWRQGPPFQNLGKMLAFYAAAGERLQAAQGTSNIDFAKETPKHPLHSLYLDKNLEERVSSVAERAFGQPLTLNRFAGTTLRLHVGDIDLEPIVGGTDFGDYIKQLNKLPTLESQGDGMKSFIGLLLNISVAEFPYVLVDEPEAFLHPPQARLLGQFIQEFKAPASQVFLATHNSNVVRGLLEAQDQAVTVVRLTRDGDVNPAKTLQPSIVKELWSDPLLRYSEVLDGLFHESVILCEGDADCRFYASVLDVVLSEAGEEKQPELLFTHCGGHHRMPTIIKALGAVGVPVKVVVDLDILQDTQSLKQIVDALDGDWHEVERDVDVLQSQVGGLSTYPNILSASERINSVLNEAQEAGQSRLDRNVEQRIREAVRGESGWKHVKKAGTSAIPQGEAYQSFLRIDHGLRELGVFLVPVGEVEGFVRTVGGHGPQWLGEVHAQRIHETSQVSEAKEFVRDIVGLEHGASVNGH